MLLTRLVHGVLLLLLPDRVGRLLLRRRLDARERRTARVLGARHVAQSWAARGPMPRTWSIGVDAAHAASMLTLAAVSPRYRRAALASAAISSAFAVAQGLRAPSFR